MTRRLAIRTKVDGYSGLSVDLAVSQPPEIYSSALPKYEFSTHFYGGQVVAMGDGGSLPDAQITHQAAVELITLIDVLKLTPLEDQNGVVPDPLRIERGFWNQPIGCLTASGERVVFDRMKHRPKFDGFIGYPTIIDGRGWCHHYYVDIPPQADGCVWRISVPPDGAKLDDLIDQLTAALV